MANDRCAICDNTNSTTRICEECRAANPEWAERPWWEVSPEDPVAVSDARQAATRPADRKLQLFTALERRILKLQFQNPEMTQKEIAKLAGCSQQQVSLTLGKYHYI